MRAQAQGRGLRPAPTSAGTGDAVLIEHVNMSPAIERGSVVFLAPPGLTGEGVYSLSKLHRADIRRVQPMGDKLCVTMDNLETPPLYLTRAELEGLLPRRVMGVALALTADFRDFLALKFGDVRP